MITKLFKFPFSMKFYENGGYDCMTDSYDIEDSNGREVTSVDCRWTDESKVRAKELAQWIVDCSKNEPNT